MSQDAVAEVVRSIEGSNDFLSRVRRVARLALPLDAVVAVAALGDDRLLDLKVPTTIHFPRNAEPEQLDDDQLIAELEAVRSEEFHFFLIPQTSLAWFDQHETFKNHAQATHRVVRHESDTCLVFALREPDDVPADGIGVDGLPVPPPEMIHLTAGLFHNVQIYERFHQLGEFSATCIRETLEKNGVDIADFKSILDFGGGCGRVIRHWGSLSGTRLQGCDYNPYLIEWAQENLPIATFKVNPIAPPMDYEDREFDFVYAISVFNHFVEALQIPWARELARVTRPGGYVYFTVAGVHPGVPEADRERYERGELVVMNPDRAGTNQMAAFAPERYIREVLAKESGFELVDFWVDGARDSQQNAVLLKRT